LKSPFFQTSLPPGEKYALNRQTAFISVKKRLRFIKPVLFWRLGGVFSLKVFAFWYFSAIINVNVNLETSNQFIP